ncbi:MAG: ROK family protein [Planctomycetota bacterium]|jgi:glucokinase|nr:ROK family protein [Planctomycetota bacterium]
MKKLGIDIGGTAIKIGYFNHNNLICCKRYTGIDSLESFTALLNHKDIVDFADNDFAGVGIGVPGVVGDNRVQSCPNISWLEDANIISLVAKRFGDNLKYAIDNDANLAAYGEAKSGAGCGHSNFAFITVGTGIGGGLIINDKIFHGPGGMAGEIGHLSSCHSLACNCGATGCVEAIASASNIEHRAGGTPLPEIITVAANGDERATKLIKESGNAIGETIAQIALLLDIRVFIFGGGGAPCIESWRPYINEVIDLRCFGRSASDFSIIQASLGNDAGVCGAAALIT